MRDSHDSVSRLEPRFHNVHVLSSDGIIQTELLSVVGWDFEGCQLCHGAPALVSHVVNDKHAASVGHLAVLPVVSLHACS